jgi:hypothetical protein
MPNNKTEPITDKNIIIQIKQAKENTSLNPEQKGQIKTFIKKKADDGDAKFINDLCNTIDLPMYYNLHIKTPDEPRLCSDSKNTNDNSLQNNAKKNNTSMSNSYPKAESKSEKNYSAQSKSEKNYPDESKSEIKYPDESKGVDNSLAEEKYQEIAEPTDDSSPEYIQEYINKKLKEFVNKRPTREDIDSLINVIKIIENHQSDERYQNIQGIKEITSKIKNFKFGYCLNPNCKENPNWCSKYYVGFCDTAPLGGKKKSKKAKKSKKSKKSRKTRKSKKAKKTAKK